MTQLPIAPLRLDGGTQPRTALDAGTVAEYAERFAAGDLFPPVVVYRDAEGVHWLADGFHRAEAARRAGLESIAAEVREGERRDAVLFAAGANAAHGLRRTNADKRRAVHMLLADPEWSAWSDREVARRCGVTHPFVARLRAEHVAGEVVTVTTPRISSTPRPEPFELPELDAEQSYVASYTAEAGVGLLYLAPWADDFTFVWLQLDWCPAGVDFGRHAHLHKPVRRDALGQVLDGMVRETGAPALGWSWHAVDLDVLEGDTLARLRGHWLQWLAPAREEGSA